MRKLTFRTTMLACYLGYVTQAIIINLLPLLFVTFQQTYGVSLDRLGLLVTVMFVTQIAVDLLVTRCSDWFAFRRSGLLSQGLSVLGLVLLCVLPQVLPDPYIGILIGAFVMSVGGGLIEVVISPIVDALPGDAKTGAMSLLHSFYCWGFLGVVLLSTVFFAVIGTACWQRLVLLWALVPLVTGVLFYFVPLPAKPEGEDGHRHTLRPLFGKGLFWLLMMLMLCAGAAELSVAQWASLFAESGLQVTKTVGDLLGPCTLAALQGVSRVVFARISEKHDPVKLLFGCGVLCVAGYLLVVLAPLPLLSLAGFGVCGIAVGPLWPGVLSLSSARYPAGGTAMFALLALCGDLGCSAGPGLVGAVSEGLQQGGAPVLTALRSGMGVSILFPLCLLMGVWLLCRHKKL